MIESGSDFRNGGQKETTEMFTDLNFLVIWIFSIEIKLIYFFRGRYQKIEQVAKKFVSESVLKSKLKALERTVF